MVEGRVLYGDPALMGAGPSLPGCETISVCGQSKFLCLAETATTNKLDQTFAEVVSELMTGLANYDGIVAPLGIAPFSPIAPLAACP